MRSESKKRHPPRARFDTRPRWGRFRVRSPSGEGESGTSTLHGLSPGLCTGQVGLCLTPLTSSLTAFLSGSSCCVAGESTTARNSQKTGYCGSGQAGARRVAAGSAKPSRGKPLSEAAAGRLVRTSECRPHDAWVKPLAAQASVRLLNRPQNGSEEVDKTL